MHRSDEPGAWYAMLPVEVVYAFDPVPPEPQQEETPTPMSRSGDGDSDDSGMDVENASSGMGDGGGVTVTPAYADWTLPSKDAHHIIGGQASRILQTGCLGLSQKSSSLLKDHMQSLCTISAQLQHGAWNTLGSCSSTWCG